MKEINKNHLSNFCVVDFVSFEMLMSKKSVFFLQKKPPNKTKHTHTPTHLGVKLHKKLKAKYRWSNDTLRLEMMGSYFCTLISAKKTSDKKTHN